MVLAKEKYNFDVQLCACAIYIKLLHTIIWYNVSVLIPTDWNYISYQFGLGGFEVLEPLKKESYIREIYLLFIGAVTEITDCLSDNVSCSEFEMHFIFTIAHWTLCHSGLIFKLIHCK